MATTQTIDYSNDIMQVLLWQYNKAAKLTALIQAKQNWYNANQEGFWTYWQQNIFDLTTANDFGCIVWAIILGFALGPFTGATATYRSFGFNQYHWNFNNSNFAPSTGPSLNLTTAQKIQVLRLRYMKIIGKPTKPYANAVLEMLFGPDNIFLIDNLNMSCVVVYNSSVITGTLLNVLENYDLIPRATGVAFTFDANGLDNNDGVLYTLVPGIFPSGATANTPGEVYSNGGELAVVPGITPNPTAPPVYFGSITAFQLQALGGGNLPLTQPTVGSNQLWNNGGVIAIA